MKIFSQKIKRVAKEINTQQLTEKGSYYQRAVANYLNHQSAKLSYKAQRMIFIGCCIGFTLYLLFLIINALSF